MTTDSDNPLLPIDFQITTLNEQDCDPSCDGCLEPNASDRCLNCKPPLVFDGKYCSAACKSPQQLNALGKCQTCPIALQLTCSDCSDDFGNKCAPLGCIKNSVYNFSIPGCECDSANGFININPSGNQECSLDSSTCSQRNCRSCNASECLSCSSNGNYGSL